MALFVLLTSLMVLRTAEPEVGIVRDEGIYMAASRRYARYLHDAARDPRLLTDATARDRAFRMNAEHPDLMKIAAGLSGRWFSSPPRATDEATTTPGPTNARESSAMRLPAIALAAAGTAAIAGIAAALTTPVIGLAAGLAFLSLPRVFFHAQLHCFDVPVAIWIFAVAALWARAGRDRRAALWVGVALGCAIGTKHNALFLGPILVADEVLRWSMRWRAHGRRPRWRGLCTARVLSVCLVAPAVAFASWPWLWTAPVERLLDYFAFHSEHAYYNMEFLGRNHNEPPMPWRYPWVMTAATVPWAILLSAVVGAGVALRRDLRTLLAARATASSAPASRGWEAFWTPSASGPEISTNGIGLVVLSLFPIVLISLPSVPIFGGAKHWITALPFVCVLAALGVHHVARAATHGRAASTRAAAMIVASLVLVLPALPTTASGHPYQTSQYGGMLGGARGGASLGLNRGYWGHSIGPLLDDLPATLQLDLHDVHGLAARQYQREGRWPRSWSPASPDEAAAAIHFYERHTIGHEIAIWNAFQTTQPTALVTLEDVPLTALYERAAPTR